MRCAGAGVALVATDLAEKRRVRHRDALEDQEERHDEREHDAELDADGDSDDKGEEKERNRRVRAQLPEKDDVVKLKQADRGDDDDRRAGHFGHVGKHLRDAER